MSLNLAGVWTALATPMNQGTPDREAWAKLVEYQISNGVDGIVVCGTTGESATLTKDEKLAQINDTIELCKGGRGRVMVGTGSSSTADSVALTKEVAALGVDATMVVTPAYNKPTPAGLKAHYAAVCEAAGETPLILYNVPGRTACNMSAEVVAAIASANANVVAIKDAGGSIWQMTENLRLAPNVTLLCGDDGLTLPALAIGALGVVSVVSNLAPKLCADLYEAWQASDINRARELHVSLQPLVDACFMESSPTPVKYGLQLLGIGDGSLRLPLAEAENATRERVAHLMREAGLIA